MWKKSAIIWSLSYVVYWTGSSSYVTGEERAVHDLVGVDPINPNACSYEEIRGKWIFYADIGGKDKTINCESMDKVTRRYRFFLDYPDIVTDDLGNSGFWTMVDSLGFEIVIHGRKFFSYIIFQKMINSKVVRFCNETILGSSHDLFGRDWACFVGRKQPSSSGVSTSARTHRIRPDDVEEEEEELESLVEIASFETDKDSNKKKESKKKRDEKESFIEVIKKQLQRKRLYKTDDEMIERINGMQSSWMATKYERYDTMTIDEVKRMTGSRRSTKQINKAEPKPVTNEMKRTLSSLPDSFDWRNVKGINYVSPVRDQGKCGSCYAFTSTGMNEARLAIWTSNTVRLLFSPQDIVDCTSYSSGCDGGSLYTIGGKYSEDYGMVEESCNPYRGVESSSCGTKSSCKRYYFTGYEYVGGYYGACTEAEMLQDLVQYGPLGVAINANEDLMFYKSGIYSPTGVTNRFNPYYEVNHAVLLVGYGVDKTHGKYWILQNSWGSTWGEDNGYFRLRRGTNECGVENDAVQSFPIF